MTTMKDNLVNDCISRQAAIKAADSIIERDTSGNNDVVKAMTAWKEYIKALPSAQPGWIPVTERLPEEEGLYLVVGDFPPGAEVHTRYFNVLHDRSVWSGTMTDKVKWWMPIPKPPEGAQGEN